MQTPEQFKNIFLKNTASGAEVRLKDVARVELGSDNYQFDSKFNGKPAAGLAIKIATGANALDTAEVVLNNVYLNYVRTIQQVLQINWLMTRLHLSVFQLKV